jgi:hypothetical protein
MVRDMQSSRYLDCLASDYASLRSAAVAAGLTDPVPSCPEWTVADLITHVGHVYLHKAVLMREDKWPQPWPPHDLPADPFAVLDLGYREVTAEFASRAPQEYATIEGGHLADDAGADTIVVTAGQVSLTVRPTPKSVSVTDGRDDTARAEVCAGPDAMLRWLWGRAGDDAVSAEGDPAWAAYLRRLLAAVTG